MPSKDALLYTCTSPLPQKTAVFKECGAATRMKSTSTKTSLQSVTPIIARPVLFSLVETVETAWNLITRMTARWFRRPFSRMSIFIWRRAGPHLLRLRRCERRAEEIGGQNRGDSAQIDWRFQQTCAPTRENGCDLKTPCHFAKRAVSRCVCTSASFVALK